MELPNGNADAGLQSARLKLKDVRQLLLDLHKALLDSERTKFEIVHGPLASSTEFLQMLISDERFAWLRPVTTLIVQIDEGLAAKKPPATQSDVERLITDTRAFFSPSRGENVFWKRYAAVVQRDPAVAQLQQQMERALARVSQAGE